VKNSAKKAKNEEDLLKD